MKTFRNNSKTKLNDIKIYEERIKKINLIWVSQIIKIIKKNISKKKVNLNDCGCNLFQLYKGIKKENLTKRISYVGYDHDQYYIKLGLKYFPELKKNIRLWILKEKNPEGQR